MRTSPPLATERVLSPEAFDALANHPDYADKRLELIGGVLYVEDDPKAGHMPTPSYLHAYVVSLLVEVLMSYLLTNPIARLFTDNTGYRLMDGSVVIPDLSVVMTDRLQPVTANGLQTIAPDLAVEVVPPSNDPVRLSAKIGAYLAGGVRSVWVVYPESRTLDTYTAQPDGTIHYKHHTPAETLDGGGVLAGFAVSVGRVFPPTTD
ncbi:MAG: Uma2 family endonuclease [Anaerolineae bacterium]|jgi:Uma2 family endonuclease|nr:Uma2 family endonuclease [Anaerolineae bacterium]